MRWVALLALAGCVKWSRQDSALEAAFWASSLIDWQQSQNITLSCDEANPILGPCGQRVPVSIYFPALLVGHAAIASLLPSSWRTMFQSFTLGMETTATYWNSKAPDLPPARITASFAGR